MTTTAIASPQLDWTRTLLTPFRKPAWRIFCAGLASGLLIVTLIGIPLLALVVMSGRYS